MKKRILFLSCLISYSVAAHVLDDVVNQCTTTFNDLSRDQKTFQLIISSSIGLCNSAFSSFIHHTVNNNFSKKWFFAHGALGAAVAYLVYNGLTLSAKPENEAKTTLAENPLYGQMLEYTELETDAFVKKMEEMFISQQDAHAKIISLKNHLLAIISRMNAIQKYTTPEYRSLIQTLQITVAKLQKAERAIVKTESWFLESIHTYAHLYNLILTYDNQELIAALTLCYNNSTYPRLALVNDLHRFQNKLRAMNQEEYAPQEFQELRKRNLNFIEIIQRIIVVVENSYEYQAERKIKNQSDTIKNLQVQNTIKDAGTLYLYAENLDLHHKLEKERAEKQRLLQKA